MFRIGQSTDIHQLVKGRKFILGGIELASDKGMLGHSDADILFHVIAEAIFGALALGDLGDHFSDQDSRNKDLNSQILVEYAKKLLEQEGYVIGNIDTIVLCQTVKISPYKQAIKDNICHILDIDENQVNIKATTGEHLGFVGRDEGILAQAIVIVEKRNK